MSNMARYRPSTLRADILEFVGKNPGCTNSEIAAAVSHTRSPVRSNTRALVAAGQLVVTKRANCGRFWIPGAVHEPTPKRELPASVLITQAWRPGISI